MIFFFFQAEDGIRDGTVTGVQTCALPIYDEEVRTRCTALLPQAKAAGWKKRAEAYLADADGKEKHDLPLLAEWERLVGKPRSEERRVGKECRARWWP